MSLASRVNHRRLSLVANWSRRKRISEVEEERVVTSDFLRGTIGLELLPQSQGVYRICTVPPEQFQPGLRDLYDVEFNAALRLEEQNAEIPQTDVRWELDLSVWIKLPAVIGLLPESLVQSSGDHLLRQIVRQISRRLTWKVQEDFHATHGLDCPPRRRAQF